MPTMTRAWTGRPRCRGAASLCGASARLATTTMRPARAIFFIVPVLSSWIFGLGRRRPSTYLQSRVLDAHGLRHERRALLALDLDRHLGRDTKAAARHLVDGDDALV